ncbi:hypothetical protein [Curtobacterium sp. MCBD17_040]|uniref:hypothetical protein n=1 Tax=Curtobacterium sp. MCBD17_040 TaxID=2175674 RepID=UPI000DA973E0|nr:hypothetical protein [Curtobacterium sp. MCBD17_040]WIB65478.1 hypothetical protein DEI94_19080 [Curtobacterium sp. MCBD17_040]
MPTTLQDTVKLDDTVRTPLEPARPTGLTALLFKPSWLHRPTTAWLQLDDAGVVVRRSKLFRLGDTPTLGARVVGFTEPGTNFPLVAAVTFRAYRDGASVLGLRPLCTSGTAVLELNDVVTATAGRSFGLVPIDRGDRTHR